jgi:hypothetical protein
MVQFSVEDVGKKNAYTATNAQSRHTNASSGIRIEYGTLRPRIVVSSPKYRKTQNP